MIRFKRHRKCNIKESKKQKRKQTEQEMILTSARKREFILTLVSVLIVTLLAVSSSLAIFTTSVRSSDYNMIKVGTLNIDFGSDADDTLILADQYPISDTEGQTSDPYTFTITNTGSLAADYTVKILDDTDMINQDGCSSNQLNKDYIKYSLAEGNPIVLGTLESSEYIIASGTLEPDASMTYNLRIWLSENASNEAIGKHFHGKIVIEATNEQEKSAVEIIMAKALSGEDNNLITEMRPTTAQQANWTEEERTEYRYIGSNPNNYVSYNNETWRIMGAFTVDNGNGIKEKRLKIISTEMNSLGRLQWGTTSNWEESTIYYFLNDPTSEFWVELFTTEAKAQIDKAVWYLGGSYSVDTTEQFYRNERSNNSYDGLVTTTAYLGLPYASDYGYATKGGSTKNRENCLMQTLDTWSSSSNADCRNGNWLYDQKGQWLLSFSSFYDDQIFALTNTGIIDLTMYENISEYFRPTVYLKKDIKFISGDGTLQNPYILSKG